MRKDEGGKRKDFQERCMDYRKDAGMNPNHQSCFSNSTPLTH